MKNDLSNRPCCICTVCTSERPWLLPAQPEVDAILEDMASNAQVGRDFVTLFLLDGSGSVTGEDFSTMTGFLMPAIRKIDTMTGGSGKVCCEGLATVHLKLHYICDLDYMNLSG